ncbi:MAG: hypothetical protein V1800_00350 [Candidatus Latescibacterota bacterium]
MKSSGAAFFGGFCLFLSVLAMFPPDLARAQETARGTLTVSASASFRNTYARGNLDDWWAERLDMPGEQVDDGSAALFTFDAGISLPLTSDALRMGASFGFIKPADHAIWGSKLVNAGTLVLKPQIISIGMPFTFQVGETEGLYARFCPSLLLGWVTGTYWGSGYDFDFVASPGIGYGLAGGMQYFFTDMLGMDLTLGMRGVKGGLSIDDPDSPTGMSILNLSNGDEVHVDLGGFYLTVGIVARLPVFKMKLPG